MFARLITSACVLVLLVPSARAENRTPKPPVDQAPASPLPPGMAVVGPGLLTPFAPEDGAGGAKSKKPKDVAIPRFLLDQVPVTNTDFLAFVTANAAWRRGAVARLFADDGYLADWESALALGPNVDPAGPVVSVSYFAARAYCEARGARLPTENEWEFAAKLGSTPGRTAADERAAILRWFGEPTPQRFGKVGQGAPNRWGIHDLHGLIWEWVRDFNNRRVSDGRRADEALVCGGGSLSQSDKNDYAGFMRAAFRSSLRGSYTIKNLGFRCALDYPKEAAQ